jgi:hypothetical protein
VSDAKNQRISFMQKMSANDQSIIETTRSTKEAARTTQDVRRNLHHGRTSSIRMIRGGMSDGVEDYEELPNGVMNLINTPLQKSTDYNNRHGGNKDQNTKSNSTRTSTIKVEKLELRNRFEEE